MRRKYLVPTLLGLLLLGLAIFVGYLFMGGNQKSYSTDMAELRRRFNEDKGRVRLVLLLSPT